ncbi:RNA methyltransferase [Candidatus Borrarchaeum sp.]|uniref:RNA methyltransferase n=1 Tax=Candidatus Borrarchaeum sp. TaxID=2846742 RepID=UPI0025810CD3|nr:RNA methyltransferase [Candidatus Borrarchaeum sp.]
MQIRIVIVEITGEINLGSICRLMKNFGFRELYLVNPKLDLNKLTTAYGFAMHAKELLKEIKIATSLEEALTDVDAVVGTTAIAASGISNPLRVTVHPEELQLMIDLSGKTAIIFGREGTGLTNEELNSCDVVVTIPSDSEYPTLNIAQAAAIILYSIFRLKKGRKHARFRAASQIEKDKLFEYFSKLLEKIRFMDAKRPIAERIFRNIIGRAFISGRECHTLLGVFRKLLSL